MKGQSLSRRTVAGVLTGVITLIGLGANVGGPGRAEAGTLKRAFTAVATSSGMTVRYGIPGFLVVENYIDGGGPVAQTLLDSGGTSNAFASLPYPGPVLTGYPGLASFVLGVTPPGYPFYASAQHPAQPEQSVEDPSGAYHLSAAAKDTSGEADARVSPPGSGDEGAPLTRARTGVVLSGGAVIATAISVAKALVVGPVSIGTVESKSVTTYQEGTGEAVTESELVLEGGKAADYTFSYGPEGLHVAQQGLPLPAGQGLTALNQALAPSGFSIHIAETTPIEGGAQAAAFEIVSVAEMPGAGTGIFRMRFGGATTLVSLGNVSEEPAAPVSEEEEAEGSSGSSATPADEAAVLALPPASPTGGAVGAHVAPRSSSGSRFAPANDLTGGDLMGPADPAVGPAAHVVEETGMEGVWWPAPQEVRAAASKMPRRQLGSVSAVADVLALTALVAVGGLGVARGTGTRGRRRWLV